MSATRRASPASSIVQQPRADSRRVAALCDSARCTPTTSCPASSIRAAATAESTPPLMAATTRISRPLPPASRRTLDRGGQGGDDGVDVRVGRGWPSVRRKAPLAVRLADAHGEQHVARLGHADLARRTRRALHASGVEQVEQRVALAARDEQVGVAGQATYGVAGLPRAGHRDRVGQRLRRGDEAVTQRDEPSGLGVEGGTDSSTATANARMAGTSSVPLRIWRSWPPP